jgi:hypothetical protein
LTEFYASCWQKSEFQHFNKDIDRYLAYQAKDDKTTIDRLNEVEEIHVKQNLQNLEVLLIDRRI